MGNFEKCLSGIFKFLFAIFIKKSYNFLNMQNIADKSKVIYIIDSKLSHFSYPTIIISNL